MRVVSIPLNDDNYGYLLIDESTNEAAIVDVSGQPEEVMKCIQKEGVRVTKILTTHKHWDHAGGNLKMQALIPGVEIIGSNVDNVEGCTTFIQDGSNISVSNISIRCILTSGHTMGHISYYAEHNDQKVVFTGSFPSFSYNETCISAAVPSKNFPTPPTKRQSPVKTTF